MMKKLAFILILSIFIINVFAQSTQGQQSWEKFVPNWFPLFSIAALIGFGLTGLAFMISRVFQLPQVETWARSELFEVVSSIFLVLIIFIVIGIIDSIFIATVNKTPMQMSLDFIDRITNVLMARYIDAVEFGAALNFLSGPPVQYIGATSRDSDDAGKTPLGGATQGRGGTSGEEVERENKFRLLIVAMKNFRLSYHIFYGADLFAGHFNLIQSIVLTSLIFSILANVALQFVNSIAIPFLVPFGMFLSMFPITRKMGRTIIATGIGLYIFVPLSILICELMYNSAYKDPSYLPQIKPPSGDNDMDSFKNKVFLITVFEFVAQLALGAISIISTGFTAVFPSCVAGSIALGTTTCGPLFAMVCTIVFNLICMLLGGIGDVGTVNDNIQTLSEVISYVKVISYMELLDVKATDLLSTLSVAFGSISALTILGISSSVVFHSVPSNVLTINIVSLISQMAS
ncbi:MAG: hypothetical protein NZ903_01900, partial [Candidatus Micrarchaeota archaeon]|nr:hypothetical protein [Candidatus Micrarchaeota archaeon]